MSDLLNLREAAALSGIPRVTLWRRAKAGKVPVAARAPFGENGKEIFLFSRKDMEALAEAEQERGS